MIKKNKKPRTYDSGFLCCNLGILRYNWFCGYMINRIVTVVPLSKNSIFMGSKLVGCIIRRRSLAMEIPLEIWVFVVLVLPFPLSEITISNRLLSRILKLILKVVMKVVQVNKLSLLKDMILVIMLIVIIRILNNY